jgi:hypothetical protein
METGMLETAEVWRGRAAQAWRIADIGMLPPNVLRVVREYASECDDRARAPHIGRAMPMRDSVRPARP